MLQLKKPDYCNVSLVWDRGSERENTKVDLKCVMREELIEYVDLLEVEKVPVSFLNLVCL